jgi:hypothetical protein
MYKRLWHGNYEGLSAIRLSAAGLIKSFLRRIQK